MDFLSFSSPKKTKKHRISRGFSLLEMLLAVFIFGAVMTSVTVYFVEVARMNQNSKLLQQNLEDTQFSMNRIAKVLRTSAVVQPSASNASIQTIRIHDFSQNHCFEYQFRITGGKGEMVERTAADKAPDGDDVLTWCRNLSSTSFSEKELVSVINGADFLGSFAVFPSNDTSGSEMAGRVTMRATIKRGNLSSTVQTSVSLRNYKE